MPSDQKNKVGLIHLTCIGLSGIIGSGWLFSSMYAAQMAGTGALITWVAGACLMLLIAVCLSELINLYPQRGLLASICSFSHDRDFSFIIAIANWFGTLCVIPSEAIATVRYLSWEEWTVIPLILTYALLNSWGVRLFAKFNTTLTCLKIVIPVVTVIALLSRGGNLDHFHSEDLLAGGPILAALISGGIIYGFNGCQMIVNFTSEARNAQRTIPMALFLSLSISAAVYILLQFTYIGSADITIQYQDPFIQLALACGLGWLAIMLEVDAALSPSGTGFSYMSSCTRMLTAMAREGQMPKPLSVKNKRINMSFRSLCLNVVISIALYMVFKTWQALVVAVSAFHVVSYLAAPLALGRLRLTMAEHKRPFTVPQYQIICPLLFFILSYLFTLTGVKTSSSLTGISLLFWAIYLVMNYRTFSALRRAISKAFFIPLWLIIFTLCSYFQFNAVVIFVLSLAMYYLGIHHWSWRKD